MAIILVVEDDAAIGRALHISLRTHGHMATLVTTGDEASRACAGGHVELVLLDLGLPDLDGVAVCERLRATHPALLIIILTARDDEIDVVTGLEAGADDYFTEPVRVPCPPSPPCASTATASTRPVLERHHDVRARAEPAERHRPAHVLRHHRRARGDVRRDGVVDRVLPAGRLAVIAGAGGKTDDEQTLRRSARLLELGASGLGYGRSIDWAANPAAMTRALMGLVHGEIDTDDAVALAAQPG